MCYATPRRLSKKVWNSLKVGEMTRTPDDRRNQLMAISYLLKVHIGPPLLNEWESLRDMTSPQTLAKFNVDPRAYKTWYDEHWQEWTNYVKSERFWGEQQQTVSGQENQIRVDHLKKLPLIKNYDHNESDNINRRKFNGTCSCVNCAGEYDGAKNFLLGIIVQMLNYSPRHRPETGQIINYFNKHNFDFCVHNVEKICGNLISYNEQHTENRKSLNDLINIVNPKKVSVIKKDQDRLGSKMDQIKKFKVDLFVAVSTRCLLETEMNDDFKENYEKQWKLIRENCTPIFGQNKNMLFDNVSIFESTENPNSIKEFSLVMFEISMQYKESVSICLKVEETGREPKVFVISMSPTKVEENI